MSKVIGAVVLMGVVATMSALTILSRRRSNRCTVTSEECFDWSDFTECFDTEHLFWDNYLEELQLEPVAIRGDGSLIIFRDQNESYSVENLGNGYFKINHFYSIFTGCQLYTVLKAMGSDNQEVIIKTRLKALKNRFDTLTARLV